MTAEDRKISQRYAMLCVLISDVHIECKPFSELQFLYDQAVLYDNRPLLEYAEKRINGDTTATGSLFLNMARVIFDKSETDESLIDAFDTLYSRKYADFFRWVKKCENEFSSGKKRFKPYRHSLATIEEAITNDPKYFFYILLQDALKTFFILRSDILPDLQPFGESLRDTIDGYMSFGHLSEHRNI